MKRALISVSDKRGVVEFARGLSDLGFEVLSTGGTAAALTGAGVPVTSVSAVSGFPEILDGRVKTLVPAIHAGILARRDVAEHRRQLEELGLGFIDVVAVNLYPFGEVCRRADAELEDCVENIDVGGPTMIRAAAKNHRDVVVVVNATRYDEVLLALENGDVPAELRVDLAAEAFAHLSAYDALIASYLARHSGRQPEFPPEICLRFDRQEVLRYGENPHQHAAYYTAPFAGRDTLARARLIAGKPLSYNNINDADAAYGLARMFDCTAVVAIKHATPCGVATSDSVARAYSLAHQSDPVSIFGGIVAANRPIDETAASLMIKTFLEVVIAPEFTDGALSVFQSRPDVRLLVIDDWSSSADEPVLDLKSVSGGVLVQESDVLPAAPEQWRLVAGEQPLATVMQDLVLAWNVARYVKSNGIVVARDGQTTGICGGQTNRIDAARMALSRSGDAARGAALASDGFFPFPDVVEAAAEAGITAIVQPGGSQRDEESIERARSLGITMLFTGVRHFRH